LEVLGSLARVSMGKWRKVRPARLTWPRPWRASHIVDQNQESRSYARNGSEPEVHSSRWRVATATASRRLGAQLAEDVLDVIAHGSGLTWSLSATVLVLEERGDALAGIGRAPHVLRESHAARITDPPAGPVINRDRAPATAGQSRRVLQCPTGAESNAETGTDY
jgi:hypothetical protein